MIQLYILVAIFSLSNGVSETAECSTRGRFPNDEVEDCRGYTMCLLGGTTFIQYKLACPSGFVYSHLEQQCTNATDYQCLPNYNCTKTGQFLYPSREKCNTFVTCINGTSNIVTARLIECPNKMVFNHNESVCVNETDYKCDLHMIGFSSVENSDGNLINFFGNFSINGAVMLHTCYSLIFYFITLVFISIN